MKKKSPKRNRKPWNKTGNFETKWESLWENVKKIMRKQFNYGEIKVWSHSKYRVSNSKTFETNGTALNDIHLYLTELSNEHLNPKVSIRLLNRFQFDTASRQITVHNSTYIERIEIPVCALKKKKKKKKKKKELYSIFLMKIYIYNESTHQAGETMYKLRPWCRGNSSWAFPSLLQFIALF